MCDIILHFWPKTQVPHYVAAVESQLWYVCKESEVFLKVVHSSELSWRNVWYAEERPAKLLLLQIRNIIKVK